MMNQINEKDSNNETAAVNSSLQRQNYSRNIAYAIILIALGTVLAPFTSIPVGFAKINPTQHFINIIAAVLLGPVWGTGIAGGIGIIRNAMGTGTLFAFPGGMIGAFLAGIIYKKTENETLALAGEVVGTGFIAPIVCSLFVAPVFMAREVAILALLPSFLLSTLAGGLLARVTLLSLKKARVYA